MAKQDMATVSRCSRDHIHTNDGMYAIQIDKWTNLLLFLTCVAVLRQLDQISLTSTALGSRAHCEWVCGGEKHSRGRECEAGK